MAVHGVMSEVQHFVFGSAEVCDVHQLVSVCRGHLNCSSDLQTCAGMTLLWAQHPSPFSQAAPDGSKSFGALLALFIAGCLVFLGPNRFLKVL